MGLTAAALAMLVVANSAAAPPGPAPNAQQPPLSVWRVGDDGGVQHLQSGLSCPQQVAGYRRTGLLVYDAYGLDIDCNYNDGREDITVYLTRRSSGDIGAAMASAKNQLELFGGARHARLLSESRSTVGGLPWSVALYGEDNGVRSAIWMADLDGWTLEYRVTYPAANAAKIISDIESITALVARSAGRQLDLCAKAPPVRRNGAAVTDAQALDRSAKMSSIAGASGSDKTKDPAPALTWCLEAPLQMAKGHALFWRAVTPSGADARLDQVSVMSMEAPPTMRIAPDASDGAGQWVASMDRWGLTLLYGYFKGRPSPQAAQDLYARVLTGEAKIIGGYSVENGVRTVIAPSKDWLAPGAGSAAADPSHP
jgi:hypothetical protein